jgi:ParB-like chromosome segregation protein Spo0J
VQGEFELIAPGQLRPHEEVDADRVRRLVEEIRNAGRFYPPVLVDRATRVILDGHHRWHAASQLRLALLPCYSVRYLEDPTIRVISRRPEIAVTKETVIDTALAGRIYPHKTTRHMYDLPEWLEPVPIDRLLAA